MYLPTVIAGAPNKNGNWELIMTDAAIGIAVHLDDRASFDRAVTTWRGRLPAYIYLTTDGSLPKAPPRSTYDTKAEIIEYWHGQTTFVDGLTQETCRDFWHTGWGLAAISHVAETAGILGAHFEVGYNALHHRLGYDDIRSGSCRTVRPARPTSWAGRPSPTHRTPTRPGWARRPHRTSTLTASATSSRTSENSTSRYVGGMFRQPARPVPLR
ncbi:hypothetical protein [Nonomuraea sp. NPDC049400]|uniref:hypothetical protein n=1 Tax=Nonomuraea sp. NPDC049400 TaxID=3364352 RepID=UPI0037B1E4B2